MSDPVTTPATTKKTEVETVKMDDGRIVEFAGKRRINKDTTFDAEHIFIRFDFRSGETRTFKTPHGQTDLQDPTILGVLKAAGHGLEQKLGDELAGEKELEDAVEKLDQLMLRLETKGLREGWTLGKEEGTGFAGASVLARALVEVTGQDIRAVRLYLNDLDNKTKLALRGDPTVAPAIRRVEEERAARAAERGAKAAAPVDTASILATLKAKASQG
jgi:hypothetical protein